MNHDARHPRRDSRRKGTWWRWPARLVAVAAVPLGCLAACQSKLIYLPQPYPSGMAESWQRETGGTVVEYRTAQGNQRAYLLGNLSSPARLWIVCGGNAELALGWTPWLREHGIPGDAWLLIDYPGYGECEGKPDPNAIRESLRTAVPLALEKAGLSAADASGRLRFLGFSLGGAACLIGASEFGIQSGVLISPFTSTMEMTRALTGLPLGFLVTHRFDNTARLDELASRGPGRVVILHGTDDEIIPVAMSRSLAARRPEVVTLREIPGARHNTLVAEAPEQIEAALREVAEGDANRDL